LTLQEMLIGDARRLRRRLLALAVLCLGLAAAPASAQIYSWRDAKGNLVLSSQRPGGTDVKTFAVPRADAIRATRPVAVSQTRLYDDLISEHARANGLQSDLVRAVVQVESAFNVRARSPKGALGLMQLMPATIQQYGVRNPFDPAENLRAGVAYLRQLLDRYRNNVELALAAYNAGPAAVDRHGQTVPPYRETQNYVSRITGMTNRTVQPRGKQIYKTMVMVDGQPVSHYSDQKPASGPYEIVGR
jgi:soluble lytic murein transglycosylase-like protein